MRPGSAKQTRTAISRREKRKTKNPRGGRQRRRADSDNESSTAKKKEKREKKSREVEVEGNRIKCHRGRRFVKVREEEEEEAKNRGTCSRSLPFRTPERGGGCGAPPLLVEAKVSKDKSKKEKKEKKRKEKNAAEDSAERSESETSKRKERRRRAGGRRATTKKPRAALKPRLHRRSIDSGLSYPISERILDSHVQFVCPAFSEKRFIAQKRMALSGSQGPQSGKLLFGCSNDQDPLANYLGRYS